MILFIGLMSVGVMTANCAFIQIALLRDFLTYPTKFLTLGVRSSRIKTLFKQGSALAQAYVEQFEGHAPAPLVGHSRPDEVFANLPHMLGTIAGEFQPLCNINIKVTLLTEAFAVAPLSECLAAVHQHMVQRTDKLTHPYVQYQLLLDGKMSGIFAAEVDGSDPLPVVICQSNINNHSLYNRHDQTYDL